MAISLKAELCGISLENPFVLASGFWGTTDTLLLKAVKGGAGAVTTKSVNTREREGHKSPIHFDCGVGLINAVGLPGKGSAKTAEMLIKYKEQTKTPVIASIFGGSKEEFREACEQVLIGNPDIIELNMSCPNVAHEFGIPFACDINSVKEIVKAVKDVCDNPVFVKLAPNVPNIAIIAKECVNAGADGITAINTMPSMVIDIYSGRPILTNKVGGLSGPAIKPIAVKAVYDIRKALPDTPIIGTGGIINVEDTIEMIMAGATAIGIGSALYYKGPKVFSDLSKGLIRFMKDNNYNDLNDMRGLAQK